MSQLRAWVIAARPATLSAAFIPVAVGTALAYLAGGFRLWPALAALGGASAIQIATNFANDVFDFEKGADTEERVGPVRAAQAGLLTPRQLYAGMVVAFGLATLLGLYLVTVAGPAIVVIGVLSILSGIAYTGGPFPLAYHGLGDVFVMVFFGFVAVGGTVFVQTGHVPLEAFIAALPVGGLATNILVVNNVRDRHTDVKVGKRTLAVRFGKGPSVAQYTLLLGLAYAVPIFFAWHLTSFAPLAPLLTLPLAFALRKELVHQEGAPLNKTLAGSAKLMTIHGALFALGLALSPLLS